MSRRVIGLGNEDRGDDAAGIEVARRLTQVDAVVCHKSLELIELWDGQADVVIVDAMSSGAAPGTVTRFDAINESLPRLAFVTSHALGTVEAVELGRILHRLPDKMTVIGIEADRLELGDSMSAEVEQAVENLVLELDDA